jgi:hypothetical protein
MLTKLASIANYLDEIGLHQEANEITNLMNKIASDKNKGKALNKPFRTPGGPKKFSVYVKNDKGNVVKVNFGDPDRSIKRDNPERRKNFRARHNCDSPGPKWKAKWWSCRNWEAGRTVSDNLKGK